MNIKWKFNQALMYDLCVLMGMKEMIGIFVILTKEQILVISY